MSDEILRYRPTEIAIARKEPPGNGRRRVRARATDERSVPELMRDLSQEGSELVRKELALAKAELDETLETWRSGSVTMAVGGGLLLGALLLFVQALNHVLTGLLALALGARVAVWLAPLILAVVVGVIGWGLFQSAKRRIAHRGLVPHATTETLRDDQRWARRKVREIKEEIRHG
jgi:hypothetical protein